MMQCLDLNWFATQDEPGNSVSVLPHPFVGTASVSDRRQTHKFATGEKIKRNPQGPTEAHMCQITTRSPRLNTRNNMDVTIDHREAEQHRLRFCNGACRFCSDWQGRAQWELALIQTEAVPYSYLPQV